MASQRTLPPKLRAQVLVPGALCHWCAGVATECDHLIEHDRGGTDTLDNLVPSCKPCNTKRGGLYKAKKNTEALDLLNKTKFAKLDTDARNRYIQKVQNSDWFEYF